MNFERDSSGYDPVLVNCHHHYSSFVWSVLNFVNYDVDPIDAVAIRRLRHPVRISFVWQANCQYWPFSRQGETCPVPDE
jgi:hypothetical protein